MNFVNTNSTPEEALELPSTAPTANEDNDPKKVNQNTKTVNDNNVLDLPSMD